MDSRIFVNFLVSSGFFYFAEGLSCIKSKDDESIYNLEEGLKSCASQECEYESDSCFIHVSDGAVRRGCLKESIRSFFTENGINLIDDCRDKHTCQLCSNSDDCNNIEIFNESCIDCYNGTDCVYEPNEKMSRTCALSVEPRGCYLQKSSLSNIQRGCLSDLHENEREICRKDGSKCKTCVLNDCNLKMKIQSCHVCDSSVDGENCKNNNQETKLCNDYSAKCFINVEKNIVLRGCLGEDMPEENCKSGKCIKCSDSFDCNRDNIHAEMCISCDSEIDPMCKSNVTHFANQICPLSVGPEGCYHHIDGNGRHIRGCVSNLDEVQKHECQRNSTTCKICLGNNCNSKNTFTQCMSCNSARDPDCIERHGKDLNKTCLSYNDECFVMTRKNSVWRGCLQEMDPKFISNCEMVSKKSKCQTCKSNDGSACNDYDITDTCIDCDSRDDPRCRNGPESIVPRICSVKNDKSAGCYLHIGAGAFRRGCLEDLDKTDQQRCYKQSKTCKSCFGKSCNAAKNYRTCYVCNSINDPYCAKASESTFESTCLNYLSSCVTGIENGYTYRNCTENIVTNEIAIANELEICSSDKCNGIVLPAQRLQCYQCSDNEECAIISTESNNALGPCQFYSELDQCYTLMKNDNTTHRGCISDLDTNRFLCDKEGALCKKCNQSGCNGGRIESDSYTTTDTEDTMASDMSDIDNSTKISFYQNETDSIENSSDKVTGGFILIIMFLLEFC